MTQHVIVGAGPAGMTLAYLLASNGLRVRVIERHSSFDREFRGELIQAASVSALRALGVVDVLEKRGQALLNVERKMFAGRWREVMTALKGKERGLIVSQPGLLSLLDEECRRFPNYRIDMGLSGSEWDIDSSSGRVVALKARNTSGAEERVDGDLFIASSGRHSALRKVPGIEAESFEQPANVLWLRFDFSADREVLPRGVDVHMLGNGVVVVLQPSVGLGGAPRLHIAYSAPGDLGALRKNIPELKARLLPALKEPLRSNLDKKLDDNTEWQILKVAVDRLKKWHVPGLLFIGDAAHTMSPSGGQGLNVAIRDAIVTANELIDAHKAGNAPDDALLARVEAARRPEVEAAQAGQIRAGTMVLKPLPALHAMFTMAGPMFWLMTRGGTKAMGAEAGAVDVKHPVPVTSAPRL
jgi:2-polyprenyl-6-methoxyphenol hydroxylase-like FAD-dependent oxidoreductase